MTDMQRWSLDKCGMVFKADDGAYVLASDAEAAIAAARAETVTRMTAWAENSPVWGKTYAQGQRDMLTKCIAAVEALYVNDDDPDWDWPIQAATRVLQALQEKP